MAEHDDVVPENCILFATADWDEPYWTNKQHCAKSLAELGVKVLYVESVGIRKPKAGSGRDWKRLLRRLRKGLASIVFGAKECSPGIFVLSPLLVPVGYRFWLARILNRWLLKITIARTINQRRFDKPLIWTYHPFMLDVIDGLSFNRLIYHCVDDLAAVPGVDAIAFREAETQLLRRADVVFATAKPLAESCRVLNSNTHFYPNVVDAAHFGKAIQPGLLPPELERIPEPRLVYHGVLSDYKVNFQLLLECAQRRSNWSWVFIGEEREGQKSSIVAELARLPNVHFLGYRPYDVLPDYLRGMQIGLLPSHLNDYTEGMFPMKYFEYIAAGLPVVSTSLAFTEVCRQGIRVAENNSDFIVQIERQLATGRLKVDEIRGFIGENTWAGRTGKMLAAVIGGAK
ncbi:glycosyltransferase [Endozoicomonas lisbonensis]|uniref:Glycosyltransferase involved in cell wall biosynthesis n=1 Tax=Endozoicomonas lisbonensis TaxID=3120522 RepID=A0ABV2SML5_9GAMM